MNESKPRNKTLSLFSLMMLLTGIAIGFAPMQWWRHRQPPKTYSISVHRAFVSVGDLEELGLPNSSNTSQTKVANIDALVSELQAQSENGSRARYWSMTVGFSEGDTPFWENGGSRDVPVVKEDGKVAVIERYSGDRIQFDAEELSNGAILFSFDIANHSPDYRNPQMVGATRVFPDIVRRLETQVEIPRNTHIAVAAGKFHDKNGTERELIWIFSASRTQSSK